MAPACAQVCMLSSLRAACMDSMYIQAFTRSMQDVCLRLAQVLRSCGDLLLWPGQHTGSVYRLCRAVQDDAGCAVLLCVGGLMILKGLVFELLVGAACAVYIECSTCCKLGSLRGCLCKCCFGIVEYGGA
jgi:hypothetical protein